MLSLSDIANTPLPAGTKGVPLDGSIVRPADLSGRGLNVLRGDLPMPVAVLKRSALANNLRVMQGYIERAGVALAPHAKASRFDQWNSLFIITLPCRAAAGTFSGACVRFKAPGDAR